MCRIIGLVGRSGLGLLFYILWGVQVHRVLLRASELLFYILSGVQVHKVLWGLQSIPQFGAGQLKPHKPATATPQGARAYLEDLSAYSGWEFRVWV